jgi:hypothetical protein
MQNGQASRLLLVLAIVVLVAVVIVFLVIRMATPAPKPPTPPGPNVELPVYEKQLGNIRFVFETSRNLGNILKASDANIQYASYLKDLTTTENFIIVTVGAQNKGKENVLDRSWDIQNIVDSDGRNFVPLDQYATGPWIPGISSCGALLKPEFDPTPCTKIYEVSKASTGLKITVVTGKNNDPNNFSSGSVDTGLLDLIIK